MCRLPSIFPENQVHHPLSLVLKHFNHILVATNQLAASVQHSGV